MRLRILDSAMIIAKSEGWNALSMRKIAGFVEYTTPVIYAYFSNKDALLKELSKTGYRRLTAEIFAAGNKARWPFEKLEAMWMAYGNFALREKELYQLMFGIDISCCADPGICRNEFPIVELIVPVLSSIYENEGLQRSWMKNRVYAYWAAVHGLIALSFIGRVNKMVSFDFLLANAIRSMYSISSSTA